MTWRLHCPMTWRLHCPIDSGAGDAEQVSELSGAVIAALEQSDQVRFLLLIEFGLLAAQTPFGFGDLRQHRCYLHPPLSHGPRQDPAAG